MSRLPDVGFLPCAQQTEPVLRPFEPHQMQTAMFYPSLSPTPPNLGYILQIVFRAGPLTRQFVPALALVDLQLRGCQLPSGEEGELFELRTHQSNHLTKAGCCGGEIAPQNDLALQKSRYRWGSPLCSSTPNHPEALGG